MRYPKFLINSFATLGVVSFIFLAYSFTENVIVDDENPPIVNTIGKYQITSNIYLKYAYMNVIDTETGVVKHYRGNNSSEYELRNTTNAGN
jgi:hypothetical protein